MFNQNRNISAKNLGLILTYILYLVKLCRDIIDKVIAEMGNFVVEIKKSAKKATICISQEKIQKLAEDKLNKMSKKRKYF